MDVRKVLDHEIAGNHAGDMALFEECHEALMSEVAPVAQKLLALRKIRQATGQTNPVTWTDVEEYMRDCAE